MGGIGGRSHEIKVAMFLLSGNVGHLGHLDFGNLAKKVPL
jgi:hypothetical protein